LPLSRLVTSTQTHPNLLAVAVHVSTNRCSCSFLVSDQATFVQIDNIQTYTTCVQLNISRILLFKAKHPHESSHGALLLDGLPLAVLQESCTNCIFRPMVQCSFHCYVCVCCTWELQHLPQHLPNSLPIILIYLSEWYGERKELHEVQVQQGHS
jgi:hypothetical protein